MGFVEAFRSPDTAILENTAKHEERILDSSLLIGFPIGRDHIYASHYEGKHLFYCAVFKGAGAETEASRVWAVLSLSTNLHEQQLRCACATCFACVCGVGSRAENIARAVLRCFKIQSRGMGNNGAVRGYADKVAAVRRRLRILLIAAPNQRGCFALPVEIVPLDGKQYPILKKSDMRQNLEIINLYSILSRAERKQAFEEHQDGRYLRRKFASKIQFRRCHQMDKEASRCLLQLVVS